MTKPKEIYHIYTLLLANPMSLFDKKTILNPKINILYVHQSGSFFSCRD